MHDQNGGNSGTSSQSDTLGGVRSRLVTIVHTAIVFLAICGAVLLCRTFIDIDAAFVQTARHLRTALGFDSPAIGPDWYLIAAELVCPGLLAIAALALLVWQNRIWRARLERIWPDQRLRKSVRTITKLAYRRSKDQHDYLTSLAASPVWTARDGMVAATSAGKALPTRQLAETIFSEVEKDVSARALAIGLAVGASNTRGIDALAIVASSWEMQLFVLGTLGKRPNLHTWRLIASRCTASLFVNTYLNRTDAMAINLVIRKAALGIEAGGEALQAGANHLEEFLQHDVHVDAADFDADELHGHLGGVAAIVGETAMYGLTVGSVAMTQIARFIETYGNQTVQGCFAGAIVYWHGMELAADILAENEEHRRAAVFQRSVRDAATSIALSAGEILRSAVRELRATYRQRRLVAVKGLGDAAKAGGSKVANTVQAIFRKFTDK